MFLVVHDARRLIVSRAIIVSPRTSKRLHARPSANALTRPCIKIGAAIKNTDIVNARFGPRAQQLIWPMRAAAATVGNAFLARIFERRGRRTVHAARIVDELKTEISCLKRCTDRRDALRMLF